MSIILGVGLAKWDVYFSSISLALNVTSISLKKTRIGLGWIYNLKHDIYSSSISPISHTGVLSNLPSLTCHVIFSLGVPGPRIPDGEYRTAHGIATVDGSDVSLDSHW